MCLVLDSRWEKRTRRVKRFKKPLILYKWLERRVTRDCLWTTRKYISPYNHHQWYLGGENESNRHTTELSPIEAGFKQISRGFHFYVREKDVPNSYLGFHGHVICKFEVDPEDIVAVGKFDDVINIVATKAKFLGKV